MTTKVETDSEPLIFTESTVVDESEPTAELELESIVDEPEPEIEEALVETLADLPTELTWS